MDIKDYIKIPEDYQALKTLPKDPAGTIAFGKVTSQSQDIVTAYPIDPESAMPFDNNEEIIVGIHHALADNQALIEVANGMTRSARRYVYSIVKTLIGEHGGVEYTCVLQVEGPDAVANVKAYFAEEGMTGMRDAAIYSALKSEGRLDGENATPWQFDPYDKFSQSPFLMDLSELESFDPNFPEHPLSELRRFIKGVINVKYIAMIQQYEEENTQETACKGICRIRHCIHGEINKRDRSRNTRKGHRRSR